MNSNEKQLTESEIVIFARALQPHLYHTNAETVYKGNIPHVGLVILNGQIKKKNRKKESFLLPGTVIGLKEMVLGTPLTYDLEVLQGTEVFAIDRSTFQELIENGEEELKKILNGLVAS